MMSSFKLSLGSALCALSTFCLSSTAIAQTYPTKTVSIVVSYPAGGDTDVIARVFAERLGAKFGQQFVVENKPGASGTIGNAFVAKSAPDGHTLLMTPSTISSARRCRPGGTGSLERTIW